MEKNEEKENKKLINQKRNRGAHRTFSIKHQTINTSTTDNRHIDNDCVLGGGGSYHLKIDQYDTRDMTESCTYEVMHWLAIHRESGGTIGHETLALGGTDWRMRY